MVIARVLLPAGLDRLEERFEVRIGGLELSAERIAAWRNALKDPGATPLAILRIPRIRLDVPENGPGTIDVEIEFGGRLVAAETGGATAVEYGADVAEVFHVQWPLRGADHRTTGLRRGSELPAREAQAGFVFRAEEELGSHIAEILDLPLTLQTVGAAGRIRAQETFALGPSVEGVVETYRSIVDGD